MRGNCSLEEFHCVESHFAEQQLADLQLMELQLAELPTDGIASRRIGGFFI